jgi:pimeloyl-ACP methyl ester carboxylesterase
MLRTILTALMLAAMPALAVAATPSGTAAAFASDRISVTAKGSGPDVILVPGLTSSPAAWKFVAEDVPGYRYHYVQVKGFAGTPAEGNAKGEVTKMTAEEIARYIAAAKLKSPAIVGHSMGGSIAMMVAARHPGSVSKAMVVDMFPFMGAMFGGPNATSESVAPIADGMMAQMAKASPDERKAQMTAMTGSMVANEAERPGVIQSALDSDSAVVASAYRELIVTDLRPDLSKIAVPTTILYVTPKGTPVPLTDAQMDGFYKAAYAGLPGAKLVRIPDSAHFIMYDNRARFAAELKGFLGAK